MKVLVTGANGFVGRNLCVELARRLDVDLLRFDVDTPARGLDEGLAQAEVVFHLAGVNRPDNVEDVLAALLAELADRRPGFRMADPLPSERLTLGEIASLLDGFHASRATRSPPDLSRPFVHSLYATYLSYLPTDGFAYGLDVKTDPRGQLAEFLRQPCFGQVYLSRTRPGGVRGNHFHHTKAEKMLVIEGEAVIRFRPVEGDEVTRYPVRGQDFKVVDIPPGYAHAIENVGRGDLVTLFWSSQVFDEGHPDTVFLPVLKPGEPA